MRFPIMEGFDQYASTTVGGGAFNAVWTNYTGIPANGFVTGLGGEGQAMSMGNSGSQSGYQLTFPDSNKITFHFAFELLSLTGPAGIEFIQFATAAASHQFGLSIDAAGHLTVWGENSAVVATSTFAAIPNQIYRCCGQADLTTGNFRLSVNGEDDAGLHKDGLDIQDDPASNLCGIFRIHQAGQQIGLVLDDIIVGIDECVDWGPQEINTSPASADVAVTWTRSIGATNFSNVDEALFNADTDYNSSSTVGQKDCFEFTDPPHVPESILCVQLTTMARKEESAVRKFREFLRIGATDYNGDEHNLAETYGLFSSSWVVNPATGVAWTASELNALQGGYELTVVS